MGFAAARSKGPFHNRLQPRRPSSRPLSELRTISQTAEILQTSNRPPASDCVRQTSHIASDVWCASEDADIAALLTPRENL
jgi:hypothetical protein